MAKRTNVAAVCGVLLGLCWAGASGAAAPEGEDTPEAIVQKQLDTLGPTLREEGYRIVESSGTRSMNEKESYTLTAQLPAGETFTALGVCDGDCLDLDIEVFSPSGALLSEDTLDDDVPVVEFETEAAGLHRVKVTMFRCDAAPCFFATNLYRKGKVESFVNNMTRKGFVLG
jgi:hypothetical protein